jgi:hypothetical protein
VDSTRWATAHTANTTSLQHELFGKGSNGGGLRKLQSADLTPQHFWLCGFFREVYSNKQPSLEKLKHNIRNTVANIEPETLDKVARNKIKDWMLVL